ncbi:family 16 glycoside hydrolase [Nonomuraea dietziae]|uniref:family 16 glycoside hydrolase n=1 Tax=Nonomuraea dietziae TaxID=65515 RepID=UPI0033DD8AFF
MGTSTKPGETDFSLDVIGRYVCNGLDEALASTDSSLHADARPFDLIVLGGGSFGAVLAGHLFARDVTHQHRILVLEAGPFALPEHMQNLPPGLDLANVWGVPWTSDSPQPWNQRFPGLAYCLGGRSLAWGGWSPYFINSELSEWPKKVRDDLTSAVLPPDNPTRSYLDEASEQIGTSEYNDFVYGPLHEALRQRLFNGLRGLAASSTHLIGSRGTPMTDGKPPQDLQRELEAPLAVQSASPRPGFFPFNKFNGMQLLIRAARLAYTEANQATPADTDQERRARRLDTKKRLMIVPQVHVIRLVFDGRRITRIVTNQGDVDVPETGRVFVAMGTVESTRLALACLPNRYGLIGRNLMAHMRSNVTIRIPSESFGNVLSDLNELAVSALFVKGVHKHDDGSVGHFHVQITASGIGALGVDAEAELFKKIPDIDTLDRFRNLTDQHVVITLRGIGEMVGDKTSADPQNRITLDRLGPQGAYDYGQPRALVRLEADDPADPDRRNVALWDVMDRACDQLALIFANGGPVEYLVGDSWVSTAPGPDLRRDWLSYTHHEGGTLWMGKDPTTSVTDEWGKFHEADNLYAVGPAVLPTLGSPNPMLSGVALTRRTADHLVPAAPLAQPDPGFRSLFDGTDRSFGNWQAVGGGAFALIDGAIVTQPGLAGELGLLYYAPQGFSDFILKLQVRIESIDDNSGIFVRSRDPRRPVPNPADPANPHVYGNKAWVAVNTGFEIQIDDLARPDGADKHRTGAIYAIEVGSGAGQQAYDRAAPLIPGHWTDCEIEVRGNSYTVHLGGLHTTTFSNQDPGRGKAAADDPHSGFIGLQAYSGRVAFRNIFIKEV